MIVYKRNNAALKHEASAVSKVHSQVCKATLTDVDSIEAQELMQFLTEQFKRGITDHKRLLDRSLTRMNTDSSYKMNSQR